MKKSALIGLVAVAGLAVVGGGAYAVTQLPSDEPTASATTEPGVIESPSASASPDTVESPAPSESPALDETDSPAPVETESAVEYTTGEAFLIEVTRQDMPELELSDEEILAGAAVICDTPNSPSVAPTPAFEGATDAQLVQFRVNAEYHVCG